MNPFSCNLHTLGSLLWRDMPVHVQDVLIIGVVAGVPTQGIRSISDIDHQLRLQVHLKQTEQDCTGPLPRLHGLHVVSSPDHGIMKP